MTLVMLILAMTVLTGLGWAGAALYEYLEQGVPRGPGAYHSLK